MLNRQRQTGQIGPQPITIHDIWSYAELSRVVPDDAEFLLQAIPALDSIFLQNYYEQQEKRSKQKKPTKGR